MLALAARTPWPRALVLVARAICVEGRAIGPSWNPRCAQAMKGAVYGAWWQDEREQSPHFFVMTQLSTLPPS